MAQHRKGAVVYAAQDAQKAKDDFWLELDHRLLDKGLPPGSMSLSQFASAKDQTIRDYRKGKREMQVDTLRAFIKSLSPDIKAVLKFLGYSESDIKAFAKKVTAPETKKEIQDAVENFSVELAKELGGAIAKEVKT